jgi:hypothetical protein
MLTDRAAKSSGRASVGQAEHPLGDDVLLDLVGTAVDGDGAARQERTQGADLGLGAAMGEITRDTLVWREGMGAWTKAGDVPDLSGLFGAVPPPLPPPLPAE